MFSGKWREFSVLRGHGSVSEACPKGHRTGVGHGSMSREERDNKGLISIYPFSLMCNPLPEGA